MPFRHIREDAVLGKGTDFSRAVKDVTRFPFPLCRRLARTLSEVEGEALRKKQAILVERMRRGDEVARRKHYLSG